MTKKAQHRVSANHLLNFSLPKRVEPPVPQRKKKVALPTRTREEFLQANFRFVIKPIHDGSLLDSFVDPNAMVEWDMVEYIEVYGIKVVCPICLEHPHAPKITRCGHIFCWSCILRYLSLSKNHWRRCPMCFDSVVESALRSVGVHSIELPPRNGTTVKFRLLERRHGQLFPSLKDSPRTLNPIPFVDEVNAKYARVMMGTREYVENIVRHEIESLVLLRQETLASYDHGMIPFIDQAESLAIERLKAIEMQTVPKKKMGTNPPTSTCGTSDGHFVYQIETGEAVFLHSFTMKCLTFEFSQENLPLVLEARVVDTDQMTLCDENKSRYRYLRHLPMYCEFYLCELDVDHLLSDPTRKKFRKDREKREMTHQKKLASELYRQIEHTVPLLRSLPDPTPPPVFVIDSDVPIEPENPYSLANITASNGYYPTLSETYAEAETTTPTTAVVSSQPASLGAWGRPVGKTLSPPPPRGKMPRSKKGKGTSLLSTAHQRRYN